MIEVLAEFLYKIVQNYGLQILYVATFVATMIYIFTLRKKENEEMLKTIQDLISSYNSLNNNLQCNMRYMAMTQSAMIAAFEGNKDTAAKIIKDIEANMRESGS